jgi:hypothetical protein
LFSVPHQDQRTAYIGAISKEVFKEAISFMKVVDVWGGTVQGASGVFNDRLTEDDVAFIKSHLRAVSVPASQAEPPRERPEVKKPIPAHRIGCVGISETLVADPWADPL